MKQVIILTSIVMLLVGCGPTQEQWNMFVVFQDSFGPHTLRIQPAPKSTEQNAESGWITLIADKNKFELKNSEFWINGKNYGKLKPGSFISIKDGILTINGDKPVEVKKWR